MRRSSFDGAADGMTRAKDLSDRSAELAGHRSRPHGASDGNDFIKRQVATVLDILDLLTVPWRLLQGLDDQGRSRRYNRDRRLSVLDRQLHSDLQSLPVAGRLGDVVTDFFRGL